MDTIRIVTARAALALALAAPIVPHAAAAERLTLADGAWIETLDGWRVEGDRVVFRTPRGAWRSLPLAELATVAPLPGGARLDEDPWGPLPAIPPPGPLPLSVPARPRGRPRLPVCVLANAVPGGPPALLCEADDEGAAAGVGGP